MPMCISWRFGNVPKTWIAEKMVFLINVFGKLNTHTERSKSRSAPLPAHSSGVIWTEQFVFRNIFAYTHVQAIIASER